MGFHEEFDDEASTMQASKGESSKSKRERERKRLKKPKVKTGCKTCKIRRVKCDETRPECLRCQRFGNNYCDGYEYDSSPSRSRSRSTSQNRGEPSSSSDGRAILPKTPPLGSLEPTDYRGNPGIQIFTNEDEFRCFCLYRDEVAPQLSCFGQSVWQGLFLQPGQDLEFVRHAIIAIGGLSKSMNMMGLDSMEGGNPSTLNSARLHEFALEHYDKFLAATKAQMAQATRQQGRRLAMVSSLLVVCIENMQRHPRNALTHAWQGLNLVAELKDDNEEFDPRIRNGLSTPAPKYIEDELLQQFNRMELQILHMYDTHTGERKPQLMTEGTLSVRNMPEIFVDINEAKLYLDLVMRRALRFMAYSLAGKPPMVRFKEDPDGASLFNLEGFSQALEFPDGLQAEQEAYIEENRRWSKAFEQLFRASLSDMNSIDAFRVLLMKVHSLSSSMHLACRFSTTQLIWDSFTPQMESLVDMSRTILKHPYSDVVFSGRSFTFDVGLIHPLLTPAVYCRDRRIRREAIELLSTRTWREAQWVSRLSADVAIFMMETEEEGVETDFIPEWARAKLTAVDVGKEDRRTILHCTRGVGSSAVHIESARDWSNLRS